MLETALEALLNGSPWALIVILLLWIKKKEDRLKEVTEKKDARIKQLSDRIDEMHGTFGTQLDTLHNNRLTDSKAREDKYQETAQGLATALGGVDTRLQVINARLPGGGDQ